MQTYTHLTTKLIARESKNSKPRGLGILCMEFLQLLIILVGVTSLARYIDNDAHVISTINQTWLQGCWIEKKIKPTKKHNFLMYEGSFHSTSAKTILVSLRRD